MKRRIVLINLLILMGIVVCTERLVSAWETFEQTNNVQRIVAVAQAEPAAVNPLQVQSFDRLRPYSDFMVISEKDLFSEDRQAAVSAAEAEGENVADAKPPVWAVRPTLHGIATGGGRKQALLTIYEGKKGNGQMRKVGLGDDVQGYTVAEIADSVVKLQWREREEIIDMADASSQQPAAKPQKVAAVTVITVGAAQQAVEATTVATAQEAEARGIQVGVVQGTRASAGRTGGVGRGQQGRNDDRRNDQRGRNQGMRGNQQGIGGMGQGGLGSNSSMGMGSGMGSQMGGLSGGRRNSRRR